MASAVKIALSALRQKRRTYMFPEVEGLCWAFVYRWLIRQAFFDVAIKLDLDRDIEQEICLTIVEGQRDGLTNLEIAKRSRLNVERMFRACGYDTALRSIDFMRHLDVAKHPYPYHVRVTVMANECHVKVCATCRKPYDIDCFNWHPTHGDRRQSSCKKCQSSYNAKHYMAKKR